MSYAQECTESEVTMGFKPKFVHLPSAGLSHITKSFGKGETLSRCEQDIHATVTHLSETALSLEVSWAHLKSCVDHPPSMGEPAICAAMFSRGGHRVMKAMSIPASASEKIS